MGQRAEELLMTIPEIQTVARKTGRAELDEHALGVNVSEIEAPFELKDRPRGELVAEVREKLGTITGANIEIGQPISHRIDAMLSGTKANIAIKLFGIMELATPRSRIVDSLVGFHQRDLRRQICGFKSFLAILEVQLSCVETACVELDVFLGVTEVCYLDQQILRGIYYSVDTCVSVVQVAPRSAAAASSVTCM